MVDEFLKPNSNTGDEKIDSVIRNAHRAVCGLAEKEITVKAVNLPKITKGLQKRGYRVIGTSYDKPGTKYTKLWFIQRGLGSL